MSFSDHTYGGMSTRQEDVVLQHVRRFLNEFDPEPGLENDTKLQCGRSEFMTSLEKLICTLERSLKEMRADAKHEPSLNPEITEGETAYRVECADSVVPDIDPELIQVRAANDEVERRIVAFMERKQREVDDINKREFCSSFGSQGSDESCARTDAVYIPTEGAASHVKVCRVVNRFGPQTRHGPNSPFKPAPTTNTDNLRADVEQRVRNMEEHLSLEKEPGLSKMQMFERIKKLEERILTLESISPEYVNLITSPNRKKSRKEKPDPSNTSHEEMTLPEINDRIATLREQLKQKAGKVS